MVVSSRSNSIYGPDGKKIGRKLTLESIQIYTQYQDAFESNNCYSVSAILDSREKMIDKSKCVNEVKPKAVSLYSLPLICATLASLLACSFPAGYNLGVINTPQTILKKFCNETFIQQNKYITDAQLEFIWSIVVSSFLIGCIIGSACAAYMSDKLGRKAATFTTALVGLISAAIFASSDYSNSVIVLVTGRIIAGLHCGICSSLTPMYLMEVSPKALKSPIGVMHCLGLTIGLFFAQVLGQDTILGSETLWPLLLAAQSGFIILGLIPLAYSPESPIHLFINQGNEDDTIKVLAQLMDKDEAEERLLDLKREKKAQESEDTWTFSSVIKSRDIRRSLLLLCSLHIGQQLSGINAVFYYSTATFKRVGMSLQQSQYASIGAAGLNVIFALVVIPLVANCSKRTLMILSSSLSCLAITIFTLSTTLQSIPWMGYVTIASMLAYVCVYGIGLGPIPYMIGADLFDVGPRSISMSLGCLANWTFNFLVAILFPMLQSYLDHYVFVIFASCCMLTAIISFIVMPKTKPIDDSRINNCNTPISPTMA